MTLRRSTKLALLTLGLFTISALFAPVVPAHAVYSSEICKNDTCTTAEVGRIMKDISKQCGNSGTCSTQDILQVFANLAQLALGLIGSLVLVMYIIGGVYMLTSAGMSGRVQTGKTYMLTSTKGLLIVLLSYVIVEFLLRVLTDGSVKIAL